MSFALIAAARSLPEANRNGEVRTGTLIQSVGMVTIPDAGKVPV